MTFIRARYGCSFLFIIMSAFLVFLLEGELRAQEGLYVHQIVIHPEKPEIVYASTDNHGMLKSNDRGETWTVANKGIKSYLMYQVAIHPESPEVLYVSSWGGGIYQSSDGGSSWTEKNHGLGNTAIKTLILSPAPEGDALFAATSTGIYKSLSNGEEWLPVSKDLSFSMEEVPQAMMLFSSNPPILMLGTEKGAYRWKEGDPVWSRIGGPEEITTLFYDKQHQRLYAGTMNKGTYRSDDAGEEWRVLKGFEGVWVNQIVSHPLHPETLYVATRERGIMKTSDGGGAWVEINNGIKETWVTTLTFHPANPETLYAGTHEEGIFKSDDGGKTWRSLLRIPPQTPAERNAALNPKSYTGRRESLPSAPKSFWKCNECHGWTDPLLDSHSPTYFRMTGNQREWTSTVKRMSLRAQLLPEEESEIIQYLNAYFGLQNVGKGVKDEMLLDKGRIKKENGVLDETHTPVDSTK